MLGERVLAVMNEEIRALAKDVLLAALDDRFAHRAEASAFLRALWKGLGDGDPTFAAEMVRTLAGREDRWSSLYHASGFFAATLRPADVPSFIADLVAIGEKNMAVLTMNRIRVASRPDAEEAFEAGRAALRDEYEAWEAERAKIASHEEARRKKLLADFRSRLEPEPGKYRPDVFEFYNAHANELDLIMTATDRERLESLLTDTIFKFFEPSTHRVTITEEGNGARSYTMDMSIRVFETALETARRLGFDLTPYRQKLIGFIPFALDHSLEVIFGAVGRIEPKELREVLDVYVRRDSDLWRFRPESLLKTIETYRIIEAAPLVQALAGEARLERHTRDRALRVLGGISPDPAFLKSIFEGQIESTATDERRIAEVANELLITVVGDDEAIRWRLSQVTARVVEFERPKGAHVVSDVEDELTGDGDFARPLMQLRKAGYEDDFLALLGEGTRLFARGKRFHAYAEYLWRIALAYFDSLKEGRSYEPLRRLEDTIGALQEQEGANWLAVRLVELRRSYLAHLAKPMSISDAVRRYNEARAYDEKVIRNSEDLFRHVQAALDVELRRWIQGEGAYKIILLKPKVGRRNYETLAQKTLKAQIENILLRKGFSLDVVREPQLLDDKRVDMLVRHGFAGPLVIEVKLTSHGDLRGRLKKKASYKSMARYMEGYGATHGIFLVLDNTAAKNHDDIRQSYEEIPGVRVVIVAAK